MKENTRLKDYKIERLQDFKIAKITASHYNSCNSAIYGGEAKYKINGFSRILLRLKPDDICYYFFPRPEGRGY